MPTTNNDLQKMTLSLSALTAALACMTQRHCELFGRNFSVPQDVNVQVPVKPIAVLTEYDSSDPFIEISLVPVKEDPEEGNVFNAFPGMFQVFYLLYNELTCKRSIEAYALRQKPLIDNPVVNPRPNGVRAPVSVFRSIQSAVLHETLSTNALRSKVDDRYYLTVGILEQRVHDEAEFVVVNPDTNLWELAERCNSATRIAATELQETTS